MRNPLEDFLHFCYLETLAPLDRSLLKIHPYIATKIFYSSTPIHKSQCKQLVKLNSNGSSMGEFGLAEGGEFFKTIMVWIKGFTYFIMYRLLLWQSCGL